MAQLVSARLSDETAERVKQYARRKQRSVNETIALALEEWMRQNEFAYIEFRDTRDSRVAYMKNSRLPVYWVVKVAKTYAMDMAKTCAYWPNRPRAWVQAALNYYGKYREEIDNLIADYESITPEILRRQLPQMEMIAIPVEILTAENE